MKFEPEKLVRAFTVFVDTIGVKSSGGRIMLGVEFFNGVFLLLALSMVLTHDLIELIVSAFRGVEHPSSTGKHFLIVVVIMTASVVFVFTREMTFPSGDHSG